MNASSEQVLADAALSSDENLAVTAGGTVRGSEESEHLAIADDERRIDGRRDVPSRFGLIQHVGSLGRRRTQMRAAVTPIPSKM
jgi:hypothetical protein